MKIYEKSDLMQDPARIANTRMVSVSYIHVEIVDQDGTMVRDEILG